MKTYPFLLSGCLLSQWTNQGNCVLRNKGEILRLETQFVYQVLAGPKLEFKVHLPLKCLRSHYTKMQCSSDEGWCHLVLTCKGLLHLLRML